MFIGTAESISNAIILLEYHLTHLKEVEQLRQEKQDIDQQLRAVQETGIGSMQSFPVPRRSERERERGGGGLGGGGGGGGLGGGGGGYGNDMDMRANQRGPSRGRGRGGRGSSGRPDVRGDGGGGNGGGGGGGGNPRYSCELDNGLIPENNIR